MNVTRRQFLAASGLATATTLVTSPAGAQKAAKKEPKGRITIYRLSLRGRRGSNAAKKHNASMRFANKHAADTHRAHPGDNSRIVPLTVTVREYQRLFVHRHSHVVDLRKL